MDKVFWLLLIVWILGSGINVLEISGLNYPCPSGYVYCEHYRCGEGYCCPWGYFYSNSCTCNCYRSLEEARVDCPDGTVFQCR